MRDKESNAGFPAGVYHGLPVFYRQGDRLLTNDMFAGFGRPGDVFPVEVVDMADTGQMYGPTAITMVKNGQYTLANNLIYWWEDLEGSGTEGEAP